MIQSIMKYFKPSSANEMSADESGSVAVEFAFVAPVFFAMMFGIYETGQVLWTQSQIGFHVDRAARIASVDPGGVSNSEIEAEIELQLSRLASGDLSVTVTRTMGAGEAPDIVRVVTSYVHTPITPFFPVNNLTLSHTAEFPLINQDG